MKPDDLNSNHIVSEWRTVGWMCGTLLSFSLMAVAARELSADVSTAQALFFRSVIGLLCVSGYLLLTGQLAALRTQRLGLHVCRNIVHFGGQYGWFVGIGLLPLAEVFALEFTVPIWTLVIAAIFLGERVTPQKIIAISLGTLGVLVILRPGIEIIDSASFVVLASAICYAITHTITKSMSASEPVISVLFYMCLVQLPIGLLLSLSAWVWPQGIQWLWLGVIGLTALSAHYCLTTAMQRAEATAVVTLDFFRLPLIALVGIVFYAEPLEYALIAGGLLMLAGNIINLRQKP